ncbi:hypothetical protein E2562_037040, partial [Oryza meyeriana var. granulata]
VGQVHGYHREAEEAKRLCARSMELLQSRGCGNEERFAGTTGSGRGGEDRGGCSGTRGGTPAEIVALAGGRTDAGEAVGLPKLFLRTSPPLNQK